MVLWCGEVKRHSVLTSGRVPWMPMMWLKVMDLLWCGSDCGGGGDGDGGDL